MPVAANKQAGEGRLVWQKYNCQACHQLYGLGGYLGPDLTNVYSRRARHVPYIAGVIRGGTGQMPGFDLSSAEEQALMEFLKDCDRSGSADPRSFNVHITGMVERK